MKTIAYSALILLLVTITSCKDDTPSIDYFAINQDDTVPHVLESNWEFLGLMDGQNEEAMPFPENLNTIFLSFDSANNFVAQGLCNTIEGHFVKSPENILELNDYAFSTDDCSGSDAAQWENEFLNNLNLAVSYAITGNILSIQTDGSEVLKFRFGSDKIIDEPSCFDFENNYHNVGLERNWILLGYIDDEINCKPEAVREMSLEFVTNDSIHGYGAINEFYGNYDLFDSDSIDVTNLLSTAVYSSNETDVFWETLYARALAKSDTYEIKGIKLILKNSIDNKSYIFKADGY